MLKRHSSQLYAETRHGVSGEGASPGYTPRHNHLLALLPLQEYEQLLPDLEPVALPLGWSVHGVGDRRTTSALPHGKGRFPLVPATQRGIDGFRNERQ